MFCLKKNIVSNAKKKKQLKSSEYKATFSFAVAIKHILNLRVLIVVNSFTFWFYLPEEITVLVTNCTIQV